MDLLAEGMQKTRGVVYGKSKISCSSGAFIATVALDARCQADIEEAKEGGSKSIKIFLAWERQVREASRARRDRLQQQISPGPNSKDLRTMIYGGAALSHSWQALVQKPFPSVAPGDELQSCKGSRCVCVRPTRASQSAFTVHCLPPSCFSSSSPLLSPLLSHSLSPTIHPPFFFNPIQYQESLHPTSFIEHQLQTFLESQLEQLCSLLSYSFDLLDPSLRPRPPGK